MFPCVSAPPRARKESLTLYYSLSLITAWDIDKQRQAEFISYHLSRQNKETGFCYSAEARWYWSPLENINEAK